MNDIDSLFFFLLCLGTELKTLGTDKKSRAKKKKKFQQREHYFREEVLTHTGLVWRWKLYMVCSVEKGSHGSIKHFLPLCGQKKSKEKEIQHRQKEQCLERQFTHAHRGLMLRWKLFVVFFVAEAMEMFLCF